MAAKKKQLIRFATDDGGYVFVDPETDKVVRVQPGNRRSIPTNTAWSKDTGFAARQDALGAPELVDPSGRPLSKCKDNNRGNAIIVDPNNWVPTPLVAGDYENNPQLVLQTARNGGEESEDICVTLGTEYVNAEAPFLNTAGGVNVLRHTATVEWGIGNAVFNAEMDWDRGKTFVLNANYVQVIANTTAVIASALFSMPPTERLSVGVGYGRGGGSSYGMKLTSIALNGTTGLPRINATEQTEWVDIPRFATHFGIAIGCVDQLTPVSDCLVMVSSNDSGFDRDEVDFWYATNESTGGQGGVFPIPNQLKRISIINRSAADWTRCNVIFNLAL